MPSLEQLNAHASHFYTPALIREMELMVLGSIEWTVKVVVPIHFIEHFFGDGCVFVGADTVDDVVLNEVAFEPTRRRIYKLMSFYADICQQGS